MLPAKFRSLFRTSTAHRDCSRLLQIILNVNGGGNSTLILTGGVATAAALIAAINGQTGWTGIASNNNGYLQISAGTSIALGSGTANAILGLTTDYVAYVDEPIPFAMGVSAGQMGVRIMNNVPTNIDIDGNGWNIGGNGTRLFEFVGAYNCRVRNWEVDDLDATYANTIGLIGSFDDGGRNNYGSRINYTPTQPFIPGTSPQTPGIVMESNEYSVFESCNCVQSILCSHDCHSKKATINLRGDDVCGFVLSAYNGGANGECHGCTVEQMTVTNSATVALRIDDNVSDCRLLTIETSYNYVGIAMHAAINPIVDGHVSNWDFRALQDVAGTVSPQYKKLVYSGLPYSQASTLLAAPNFVIDGVIWNNQAAANAISILSTAYGTIYNWTLNGSNAGAGLTALSGGNVTMVNGLVTGTIRNSYIVQYLAASRLRFENVTATAGNYLLLTAVANCVLELHRFVKTGGNYYGLVQASGPGEVCIRFDGYNNEIEQYGSYAITNYSNGTLQLTAATTNTFSFPDINGNDQVIVTRQSTGGTPAALTWAITNGTGVVVTHNVGDLSLLNVSIGSMGARAGMISATS